MTNALQETLDAMPLELDRLQARIRNTYVRGMSLAFSTQDNETLVNDVVEMVEMVRMAESALGNALSAASRAQEVHKHMNSGGEGA